MVYFQYSGSNANITIFLVSFASKSIRVTIWDVYSYWLVLAKGDNTAPILVFMKLYKALSLNFRDLKNVYWYCLNCILDPAYFNM